MPENVVGEQPCVLRLQSRAAIAACLQSAATSELDPEYRMALARTRQATAIHRAIGFLNTGSRARWVRLLRGGHSHSAATCNALLPELCKTGRALQWRAAQRAAHLFCRAHVEVRRALHQNSLCRAPLLSTQHSKADLCELYRLHLQQAEVPADFGTLLQLRALLDMDFEEAETIEREVAEQNAFSI